MSKAINILTTLADRLEGNGKTKTASKVDKLAGDFFAVKTAQYVGTQGYWIRNGRCWQNCYRQKRANSPNKAVQDIWFECQSEYVESINNDESGWEKYASDLPSSSLTKFASQHDIQKIINNEQHFFKAKLAQKLKDGWEVKTAVFDTLDEGTSRRANSALNKADQILSVAKTLRDSKDIKSAQLAESAAAEVVKEAQAWQNMWSNLKGIGNQFGNMLSGRNQGTNFNFDSMMKIIKQLENTLQGYRSQKYQLDQMLDTAATMGGSGATVAKQMKPLLKNLNQKSLEQMKQLANNWAQQSGLPYGYPQQGQNQEASDPEPQQPAEEAGPYELANDPEESMPIQNAPETPESPDSPEEKAGEQAAQQPNPFQVFQQNINQAQTPEQAYEYALGFWSELKPGWSEDSKMLQEYARRSVRDHWHPSQPQQQQQPQQPQRLPSSAPSGNAWGMPSSNRAASENGDKIMKQSQEFQTLMKKIKDLEPKNNS